MCYPEQDIEGKISMIIHNRFLCNSAMKNYIGLENLECGLADMGQ